MSDKPLVTVITPCYNGEEFIDGYFQSILNQTYDRVELIFVNDGSTDRTEEIALSYQSALENRGIIFKYLYQQNGGQASAMNTGFKEMTGKYLVWPDSDDLLSADSIEKRVEFLEKNPQYLFVRSHGDFIDFSTKQRRGPLSHTDNRFHEDIFLDLITEDTYCACGCYMIKTETLRQIYPDLKIYESFAGQNWQILIPIAGQGLCGLIDEELYHVAVRSGSHSRHKRTWQEERDRFLELKKILEIGIALSKRCDRNYQHIVDVKYERILFCLYMNHEEFNLAQNCYMTLKEQRALRQEDRALYLQKRHPWQYKVFCVKNLGIRVARKVKRMVLGK